MCTMRLTTCLKLISFFSGALALHQLSATSSTNHDRYTPIENRLFNQTTRQLTDEFQPFSTRNRRTLIDIDDSKYVHKSQYFARVRRQLAEESDEDEKGKNENNSNFQQDEIGWSKINEQVDMVIPMVLMHLQKLNIEYLQLPDIKETITVSPLFISYEAGLFLSNGIVYNMAGLQRQDDAFMTYKDRSFLCRFNILIKSLQFEYNFLLKLFPIEGYGKVIGSLNDTTVHAELAVNVVNTTLKLNDFRITKFSNIHVQLDLTRIIRELTGAILSPITNLFKDRITTSISDGLKEQMQLLMDDFNGDDPLELRKFTKKMLASLTGGQLIADV